VKKTGLLIFLMVLPGFGFSKMGFSSLKERIQSRQFIFGAQLLEKTAIDREVFYKVLVQDVIKGAVNNDTLVLNYMYRGCTGNFSHLGDVGWHVICLVDFNALNGCYGSSNIEDIKCFNTKTNYTAWFNYHKDAWKWIHEKELIKRNRLKNVWIAKYVSDTLLQNEIFTELELFYHEYGKANQPTQKIIKEQIMLYFYKDVYCIAAAHMLTHKHKKQMLSFIISQISNHNKKLNCTVMEAFWLMDLKKDRQLYNLYFQFCESDVELDTQEQQNMLDKWKSLAK
jgi:hypothetical protein